MKSNYKGIILAGGSGTRLHPVTLATSKQLLPVYDKPMIYYPLSTLMLAGISEILIISTPEHLAQYQNLLGTGKKLGISISYLQQCNPDGVPQGLIIAEDFIGSSNIALILGDNLFFGEGFQDILAKATGKSIGATVFGYRVKNPEQYGVLEFDSKGIVKSIEEKPLNAKSNYVVTGLYFYDNNAINFAKKLVKSKRDEYEITDLNNIYLKSEKLFVETLGRGFAWLDAGTHEDLAEATQLVRTLQNRHGLKVACLEEIAFNKGWLNKDDISDIITTSKNREHSEYLMSIINNN